MSFSVSHLSHTSLAHFSGHWGMWGLVGLAGKSEPRTLHESACDNRLLLRLRYQVIKNYSLALSHLGVTYLIASFFRKSWIDFGLARSDFSLNTCGTAESSLTCAISTWLLFGSAWNFNLFQVLCVVQIWCDWAFIAKCKCESKLELENVLGGRVIWEPAFSPRKSSVHGGRFPYPIWVGSTKILPHMVDAFYCRLAAAEHLSRVFVTCRGVSIVFLAPYHVV